MSVVSWLNGTPENRPDTAGSDWAQFPILTLMVACGLWVTTVSHLGSRSSQVWAMSLFWVGVLLMYVPVLWRLWQPRVSRRETLALLLVLGLGLYLVALLRSPLYFSGFDALLHLRTASDILQTGRLFTQNTLLPVSPLYPGLELATGAVASLGGLDIFEAGLVVVGAARVLMLLALYLIFERVSRSSRTAGLAVLIYMGSSTFVFFDAAFSYESLGLPLAFFTLYLLVPREAADGRLSGLWEALAVLAVLAVGITHHLTAYILTLFLFIWSLVAAFVNRRGGHQHNPILIALLSLAWNVTWLFFKAPITIGYLAPYIQNVVDSVQNLLSGRGGDRQLLTTFATGSSINYERILALGSVGVTVLGLGLGLWQWWRAHRRAGLAFALALAALAYPLLPALRLNTFSWEAANRLSGPLYLAIGFIVALGIAELPLAGQWARLRHWAVLPGVALVFVGGIIGGSSPDTRLPGPYMVSADQRSVDTQGVRTAELVQQTLGPNKRMISDRVQTVLMGSYGGQRLVLRDTDGIDISGIFLDWNLGPNEQAVIREGRIQYAVVDRRLSTGLPLYGYYYEDWEQMVVSFVPPVNPAVLDKFNYAPKVSRLFDSGDIVIYDLSALGRFP